MTHVIYENEGLTVAIAGNFLLLDYYGSYKTISIDRLLSIRANHLCGSLYSLSYNLHQNMSGSIFNVNKSCLDFMETLGEYFRQNNMNIRVQVLHSA